MPALVETMMYTREKPWHGLGVKVDEAPNSAEAIKLAGLDWEVLSKPIFTDSGIKIPNYVANTRSSDSKILGVVSDRYQIVQNKDAFTFTDNLIGDNATYETAGALKNGKVIWLLAKLPTTKILDDDIDQYICFTNTHDGTGAVRACCTPIRVVCNNTLNLALSTAKRVWSCVHKGKIEDKLIEASQTLELANKYTEALDKKAQQLANTSLNNDKIKEIINELFPIDTTDSDRQIANIEQAKKEFMVCYYMPDIAKFQNTAWGLVNAASDFISHTAPKRNTATYNERNFERIIYGHPFIDKITDLIAMKK